MGVVEQLLKKLDDQGTLITSPYVLAEALEREVDRIVGDFLEASPHCKLGEEEGTYEIPGPRLLKLVINHPLLSLPMVAEGDAAPQGVEVAITVARMENLRQELSRTVIVHNADEALQLMMNIVYGIDPPTEEDNDAGSVEVG